MRTSALFRELGVVNTFLYLCHRMAGQLSRGTCGIYAYEVLVQPVAQEDRLRPRHRGDLDVRVIGQEAVARIAASSDPRDIPHRIDRGDVCLAGFLNGEPVGFLWITEGPFDETEVCCTFVPQPRGAIAWDYDLFIDPKHRGGIVFPGLWDAANAYLRTRGFRWTASRVSSFNAASLRAHLGLGALRVGKIVFLSLLGMQVFFGTLHPYFRLSVGSWKKPSIIVSIFEYES